MGNLAFTVADCSLALILISVNSTLSVSSDSVLEIIFVVMFTHGSLLIKPINLNHREIIIFFTQPTLQPRIFPFQPISRDLSRDLNTPLASEFRLAWVVCIFDFNSHHEVKMIRRYFSRGMFNIKRFVVSSSLGSWDCNLYISLLNLQKSSLFFRRSRKARKLLVQLNFRESSKEILFIRQRNLLLETNSYKYLRFYFISSKKHLKFFVFSFCRKSCFYRFAVGSMDSVAANFERHFSTVYSKLW